MHLNLWTNEINQQSCNLNNTVMLAQYDFQEQLISEHMPHIEIPSIAAVAVSSRSRCSASKAIVDLERFLLQEKEREKAKVRLLKEKQQYITEQVEKQLANKERKIRELEEKQRQKTYAQCTFQPKTLHKKGQKRNLNQFLEHQSQFTKKVEEKKTNLKKTLDEAKAKETYQPKINKTSEIRKHPEISVYQRLYALKDKQNEQANQQQTDCDDQFYPKITEKSKKLTRNVPIEDLLYGDALRRQEKAKEPLPMPSNSSKFQKSINYNNERYVAQKFIKEYFLVLQKFNIPSASSNSIQYLMFNQILKEMGFVQLDQESDNYIATHERALIHDAFQILQKFQVNAKNICVFLLALIGIFHINPVNFEQGEQPNPDKQFALDEQQGRKLQKHFDLLKRNRLSSESKRKGQDEKQFQSYSFHPSINKASQEMAEKYRSQMLAEANKMIEQCPQLQYAIPEDGVINHTDLLVLNNLAKDMKNQFKKEELEKKNLEKCTFKPATLTNSVSQTLSNSKVSNMEASLGNKKSAELYNYHKSLQIKKESMRASAQKNQPDLKECTFTPNTNHPRIPTTNNNLSAKDIPQTIYRLQKGREEHENKKKFLERGEKPMPREQTNSNKKSLSYQHDESEQVPTLILDVNLGDKLDRIVIYRGDENRLEEVAREFALRHRLQESNQKKLCELLHIQLQNVLTKIQEDEESEQNQY